MEKWPAYKLSELRDKRDFWAAGERASGARFRALDVRLLLVGQKQKLVKPVKPVNRAKRRHFISNLQGKTKME